MKQESTQMKDSVRIAIKTPFILKEIPNCEPPKSFQVKFYRPNNLVMIIMDKELYQSIEEFCKKRNLRIENVLYGTIMKTKELLREGEKKDE